MSKMERNGAVVLLKKRDASASEAKGIKIFPCRADGSPDYSQGSQIIWFDALEALKSGKERYVGAFFSPPMPLKSNPSASPSPPPL